MKTFIIRELRGGKQVHGTEVIQASRVDYDMSSIAFYDERNTMVWMITKPQHPSHQIKIDVI